MYKWWGYDVWCTSKSIVEVLQIANDSLIAIYSVELHTATIFYTKVHQRKLIYSSFEDIQLIKTTGFFGLVCKHYTSILLYIRLITIVSMYSLFMQTTFTYQIIGVDSTLKEDIIGYMQNYTFPIWNVSIDSIYQSISEQFSKRLSWIEVYKDGIFLKIHFSEKTNTEIKVLSKEPLLATKDSVIVSFDVQHGTKKVKVHDFVRKGTVLVDGYLIDSFHHVKEIFVKGKVYGYTWYTIESSLTNEEHLHESIQYFRLLFDCRNQISRYLDKNEDIVKETILLFSNDEGTIRMLVHYTLLEDITIP